MVLLVWYGSGRKFVNLVVYCDRLIEYVLFSGSCVIVLDVLFVVGVVVDRFLLLCRKSCCVCICGCG